MITLRVDAEKSLKDLKAMACQRFGIITDTTDADTIDQLRFRHVHANGNEPGNVVEHEHVGGTPALTGSGALHAHTHTHTCQLDRLRTYVAAGASLANKRDVAYNVGRLLLLLLLLVFFVVA